MRPLALVLVLALAGALVWLVARPPAELEALTSPAPTGEASKSPAAPVAEAGAPRTARAPLKSAEVSPKVAPAAAAEGGAADPAPELVVEGTVVTPVGVPVTDTRVGLFPVEADGAPATKPSASAAPAADGRFRLGTNEAGEHVLVAAVVPHQGHPELRPATVRLALGQGSPPAPVTLVLDEGLVVSGLVVTPSGAPAGGSRVGAALEGDLRSRRRLRETTLWWAGGAFERGASRTETDADGRFRLTGLGPDEVGLWTYGPLRAGSDAFWEHDERWSEPLVRLRPPASDVRLVHGWTEMELVVVGADGAPLTDAHGYAQTRGWSWIPMPTGRARLVFGEAHKLVTLEREGFEKRVVEIVVAELPAPGDAPVVAAPGVRFSAGAAGPVVTVELAPERAGAEAAIALTAVGPLAELVSEVDVVLVAGRGTATLELGRSGPSTARLARPAAAAEPAAAVDLAAAEDADAAPRGTEESLPVERTGPRTFRIGGVPPGRWTLLVAPRGAGRRGSGDLALARLSVEARAGRAELAIWTVAPAGRVRLASVPADVASVTLDGGGRGDVICPLAAAPQGGLELAHGLAAGGYVLRVPGTPPDAPPLLARVRPGETVEAHPAK